MAHPVTISGGVCAPLLCRQEDGKAGAFVAAAANHFATELFDQLVDDA
jgi:hypothetical protein